MHSADDTPPPGSIPEPAAADLLCPSCGYCVFGVRESRCPECGEAFEWAHVLALARGPRPLLFEFSWRSRPAAALARTWYLSIFRPGRLWNEYNEFARPPAVSPLLLLMFLQMLLFVQGWPALGAAFDLGMNALGEWLTAGELRFTYDPRYATRDVLQMGLWYALTFVALQLFFQTKQQRHLRWPWLLRVQVHALMAAATGPAAWCLAEAAIDVSLFFRGPDYNMNADWYLYLKWSAFVLGLIVTWFLLGFGLRRHLRFPNAYFVAGAALLCGYLLADLVTFWW